MSERLWCVNESVNEFYYVFDSSFCLVTTLYIGEATTLIVVAKSRYKKKTRCTSIHYTSEDSLLKVKLLP